MNHSTNDAEAREQLVFRLYTDGVIGLDEVRYWAYELELSPAARRRLLVRCIEVHHDAWDEPLAA